MLDRLIDQFFPTSAHNPDDARHLSALRNTSGPHKPEAIWGDDLPPLVACGADISNLETSVTT